MYHCRQPEESHLKRCGITKMVSLECQLRNRPQITLWPFLEHPNPKWRRQGAGQLGNIPQKFDVPLLCPPNEILYIKILNKHSALTIKFDIHMKATRGYPLTWKGDFVEIRYRYTFSISQVSVSVTVDNLYTASSAVLNCSGQRRARMVTVFWGFAVDRYLIPRHYL